MKRTHSIAQMLLASAVALFVGCSTPGIVAENAETKTEKEENPGDAPLDSPPPLVMDLCVLFQDDTGRNLVSGIPVDKKAPIYDRGDQDIDPAFFTLTTQVDKAHPVGHQYLKTYFVGGGTRLLFPLFMMVNDIDYKLNKVVFTVTCPYVFGDEKAHTVVGYCNHDEFWEPYYTRIEVDGKAYAVEKQKGHSIFLVTVVIDR